MRRPRSIPDAALDHGAIVAVILALGCQHTAETSSALVDIGGVQAGSGSGGVAATGGFANGGVSSSGAGAGGAATGAGAAAGGKSNAGAGATGTNTGATNGSGFSDEFNGTSLDSAWVALNRHGDFSAPDLSCYLPQNVAVNAGNLALSVLAQAQTCGDSTHDPVSAKYTAAMVQWKSFNFTYGTLEVRAKMAGGVGPWPAVWLLGANCQASNVHGADNVMGCNWPNAGSDEIDFVEILNNDHMHVNQQIHSGSSNAGCVAATTDVTKSFHTYKLEWRKDSLVWSIDGAQTCSITSGVPSTPMFVIISDGLTGTVTDSTLPQVTSVDYVRLTSP